MAKTNKRKIKRSGLAGFWRQSWRQVWRFMVTGLLVWVPLIITGWVSWLVIYRLGFGVENLIKRLLDRLNLYYYPGLGFLIVVALFLTTGFLARYWVGRKLISVGERLLERIPLISKVYGAVVQIRDVFVSREGSIFQYVCLIEYPRPGMIAIAFVTSAEQGIVQESMDKELVAVFVPTTPNPTSGYLVYVPPEDITLLDINVEEAMKLIVSGGAYIPGKTALPAEPGEDGERREEVAEKAEEP